MKQTRTTLKELTAMYRAVLRHGILCNAIALGLIAATPAMADNSPNTSAVNPAWVFGDITLADAPVGMATIGGRRINNWDGTKYQNDIPQYHMVGQSLSVTNSDMYVGPVSLELREIDAANDTFAYNYQWDTDGDEINNDVDLANWAGVGWNEEYATIDEVPGVYAKVAAKINSDPNEEGYYDNAGDTAPGVYMFSRLDTEHTNAGAMSFSGSTVTTNGTTVNADSISVTNGSTITVVNEDTLSLTAFNGGNIDTTGVTTLNADTMNIDGSRMVVASGAELTINPTTSATFQNSTYDGDGGAILNSGTLVLNDASFLNNEARYGGAIENIGTGATAQLTVNGGSFENNSAKYGGAIDNDNAFSEINGAVFTGNSSTYSGGAIYAQSADITNTNFTGNSAGGKGGAILSNHALTITGGKFEGNHAGAAGVLYDNSLGETSHSVTINGTKFVDNYAGDFGAVAIFSSDSSVTNATFTGNQATADYANLGDGAGALFLGSESQTVVSGSTFKENYSGTIGGAIATRPVNYWLDTDYSDKGTNSSVNGKVDILSSTFDGNEAGTRGGALFNSFYNSANKEGSAYVYDSTFKNNTADLGGAIYNEGWQDASGNYANIYIGKSAFDLNTAAKGGVFYNDENATATLDDSQFTGNTATDKGGALYNAGIMNVVANGTDVTFSGNKANGVDNDIYNAGTLTLTAADGKTISLAGGIDGAAGTLNINGAGTVEVANTLMNQTTTLSNGELHLNNVDLTGSTVTVASGATINTIDNLVNDYTGAITLTDGANIKGDIDFMNGTADKYLSTGATSVNYKVGNLIGSVGNGTKNIQVASDGTTVNYAGFAWATSTEGLSMVSSGNADGMVAVTGLSGGIAEATDVSANVNEIDYTLTAAETLTTAKTMYHNFALTGGGTNDTDNGLNLAANLSTDENASVKISKLKLSGLGTLNNAGLMRINDSLIDVDVNNSGVLISDPTTYSGTVTNSNFASFDNDTFTATATLANTGTVSLYNGVTFDAGASITGAGVTNLVSGYTHFHDTANANTINVVSGANFDGAIVGGKINTQNGMIDNFAGSIQNMDVAMDVNTASGTADTFASITGSTIKSLSVSGGYGTADSVDVTIGSGLTLDSATEINGGYYTKVEQSGTTLTFSDKLVNASGMQANAAKADYSASGTYADGTIGKAIQGKQDTLTAGDAITISSDSNISVADSGITTGKLADGAVTTDKIADGTITFADLNAGAVATSTTVNLASPSDEKLVTEKAVVAGITNLVAEKETWVNNTLGITAANPNAVNDEYVGTNYLTSATTLTGADIALDSAIKANANDIAKIVDGTTVVAKAYADEDGNNIKTTYATKAEVTAGVTAVYDHAHDWAESLLGLDVDENVANQLQNGLAALGGTNNIEATTIAGALHELDTEKQNIITDTATIAADGTGFSVVAGSIDTAQLKDGGVTADKLADGAVTSGKVADGAITTAKIADGTITFADLNAGMVVKSGTDVNIATPSEEKLVTEKAVVEGITSLVEQKQAWVDATLGITSANANAVNNEYTGTTYLTAATTLTGADKALDAEIVRLDADETTTGSVAKKVKDNARNATYDNSTSALLATTLQGAIDENASNTGNLGTLSGNHVTANTSVVSNLNQLSAAIDAAADSTLAAANTYTDQRVESMDKNLSAGVAGAVALSAVATSGVERGEVSVGAGYGYFNGQSAAAFGATMGLTNNWSVNAGAGVSNADVSFRAGTNYKFKLF